MIITKLGLADASTAMHYVLHGQFKNLSKSSLGEEMVSLESPQGSFNLVQKLSRDISV